VFKVIRANLSKLGIDRMVFDLVYEGFWDLYCKKPLTPELTVKKMEGFIQKFKLVSSITGKGKNKAEDEEDSE